MGFQLHETMYGKNFFEHQLPALIRAINRLADVDEKRQAAEPAAVMKSNTVYVCYEENSHELAIEDGAVNELFRMVSMTVQKRNLRTRPGWDGCLKQRKK